MPTRPFMKIQDRVPADIPDGPARLDATDLVGAWRNTDPASAVVARAVVAEGPGPTGLSLRIEGGDGGDHDPAPDWGPAPIDALFAASPDGRAAVAFTARHDAPGARVEVHANLSKGLLILTTLASRPDAGGDEYGTFAREFFRKVDGGG